MQHRHFGTECGPLETGLHLSLLCPFAKAVWSRILSWEHSDGQSILTTQDPRQFKSWWDEAETKIAREERRRFNMELMEREE
jgi:hypothetical protein